ncbi:YncE family protein [Krasilnikoviella flava]|uniref:YncE family protein n=1 Tax=Krasilnikoviella flava TaxID=526729 RepID=UPI00111C2AF0|nr:YncE family protein [Krasilnikoviella flava]
MTLPRPARRRARAAGAVVSVATLLALGACAAPEAPAAAGGPGTPAAPTPTSTPTPSPSPSRKPEPPQLLLVTQAARDTLAVVDPTDRRGSAVVDEIAVGAAPWDVAVDEGSRRAYVSTAEGIAVVDLGTRERTDLFPYAHQPDRVAFGEYRRGGLGLAVSPDGGRVHVAVSTGDATFLETLDADSGEVVSSVPVGLRPFDVLVSDDGDEVYTVDHDGFTVTVVDPERERARAIEVAPFGREGGLASFEKPHYAVLDDAGDLLLPYQGRLLARVDPATGVVTTTELTADSHQHGVARADDGTLVIAGNGPFGNAGSGPSIEVVGPDGTDVVLATDRRHETVAVWRGRDGETYGVLAGGYTQQEAWDGATVIPLDAALDGADESYEITIPGRPQAVVPVKEDRP